jgi:AraC-like DNA-binding protein
LAGSKGGDARKAVNQEDQPNQGGKDYQTALREKQVVLLRLRGKEFEEIAEQCGYADKSGAWRAWKRAIRRIPEVETKEERRNSAMRLNAALDAIWGKVLSGDLLAIARMVDLEKRRAELLNLDIHPKAPDSTPATIIFQTNFDVETI